MAIYKFAVVETRTVTCHYAVEADTLDEAEEMAGIGDTTFEESMDDDEVIDREIICQL